MLTIGFTNHYYTLWSVYSFETTDSQGRTFLRTNFNYRQNLSFDFDIAKAKVAAITEEYEIDLELRGENGSYFTQRMIKFGTTYVEIYATSDGKLVKYMGAAPPAIEGEFVKVKATVKHSEYNGKAETKLQRIKII